MQKINITELRSNLPYYLKKVKKGTELQITSNGKCIARIVPEKSEVEKAIARLLQLRGTMITGNVIDPIDSPWNGDADNL